MCCLPGLASRSELEVEELHVSGKSIAVGKSLKNLGIPPGVRIASITRNGSLSLALAEDILAEGDQITLIGPAADVDAVKDMFQKMGVVFISIR